MTRLFFLSAAVFLLSHAPVHAQDPPKHFNNSFGMSFVWIEPGTFTMGSPATEKDRSSIEIQHRVKLTQGFYMGVYPVTQGQWFAVMAPGYDAPAEGFDLSHPSRFHGSKNLPAETVSWNDCQEFIKKLRRKVNKPYRLPTEAEWEYACRAGTTTAFYFGNTPLPGQANFAGGEAKKGVQRQGTTPVGSFPPNAWGLFDMHGNVAQWCQDRFGNYAPQSAVNPQGASNRGSRILRGGSWEDAPGRCRSACRAWDSPDTRGRGTYGFRLCFSLE